MAAILGISAFYHDSAAALVVDGRIVAAAQEERFTRKKHDAVSQRRRSPTAWPRPGSTPADLDYVGFYDKPLLKFERLLETYLAYAPGGFRSFRRPCRSGSATKLFLPREMRKALGGAYTQAVRLHRAPRVARGQRVLPVAVRGGRHPHRRRRRRVGHRQLRHRPGQPDRADASAPLPALARACSTRPSPITRGFRVNSGEYKLMGLAPYGEPTYADLILEHLIDLKDDGSFRMDMSYFNYCQGLTMTSPKFHRLFGGPPRKPESPLTQREMDLAASIQVVTEEIMLRMARHVHESTGMKNLCLAGGVALNCVANGRILREGPFERLWIQPAAGDAGGALGVALFI